MSLLTREDRLLLEINYWNEAAKDPDVDNKFICNLSTKECLEAIGPLTGKVLEIGCGVGRLMKENYYGIDISKEMIEIAKKRRPECVFKVCDGRTIPYADETFHCVYSMLVFQHLDKDGVVSYLNEAYRVLIPGGKFRFQFIEGDEDEPFSHHYDQGNMWEWLKNIGFTVASVDNLVHPQWTWITAIK